MNPKQTALTSERLADKEVIKSLLREINKLKGVKSMTKLIQSTDGSLYLVHDYELVTADQVSGLITELQQDAAELQSVLDAAATPAAPVVPADQPAQPETPTTPTDNPPAQPEQPVDNGVGNDQPTATDGQPSQPATTEQTPASPAAPADQVPAEPAQPATPAAPAADQPATPADPNTLVMQ